MSQTRFGENLPVWPAVDFSEFGETQTVPLSRIQSLTSGFMHRNWISIPHVTHHDDVDITRLEEYRKSLKQSQPNRKVTPLAFQIKAIVKALEAFPQFNASLDGAAKELTLKNYFNIGFAVDVPAGLLVPVVRDCNRKTVFEIAEETRALAEKAREKGLTMNEMSGGCMTISSLGGIGGTAFTPIINAPEVAILGTTKIKKIPAPSDEGIEWRTVLPVSLSYDHRVINGADAARFTRYLEEVMSEPEKL